jgi:histidine ammonia-lyase
VASIVLDPGHVGIGSLRRIARSQDRIELTSNAKDQVEACARYLEDVIDSGQVVYALNTGFGKFSQTQIARNQIKQLQRNLVTSHATGVGDYLADHVVRLMLALKVMGLARGYSGVSWTIIEHLLRLIETNVLPCIPAKGSVGASGDLAPLSHLACALIGIGRMRVDGRVVSAEEGLRAAGLEPIELGPKEGVAIVNGTQASTALAFCGLFMAEDALAAAICAGAVSVEAAAGLHAPYDARSHELRGQQGQKIVASRLRTLLEGSEIRAAHSGDGKVQDPYSLRCQAQVMGAALDCLDHAARILTIEANGVSDSPLIFVDDGDVVSGGNFHAQPVGMAADILAMAICEIGSISERRLALLCDSGFSGLPPFLVEAGGLNSGFMNVQVTAAALASENKGLAFPGSVDTIPTSAGQEDHVAMSAYAARRTMAMAWNASRIVAGELMAGAQGVTLRRPLRAAHLIEEIVAALRERVSFLAEDRYLADDLESVGSMIDTGVYYDICKADLPSGRDGWVDA